MVFHHVLPVAFSVFLNAMWFNYFTSESIPARSEAESRRWGKGAIGLYMRESHAGVGPALGLLARQPAVGFAPQQTKHGPGWWINWVALDSDMLLGLALGGIGPNSWAWVEGNGLRRCKGRNEQWFSAVLLWTLIDVLALISSTNVGSVQN